MHTDLASLTKLEKTGHLVAAPAPTATRGLVDALFTTVASIAVSKAIGFLGQSVANLLGKVEDAPLHSPPATDDALGSRIFAELIMLRGHIRKSRHDSNYTS